MAWISKEGTTSTITMSDLERQNNATEFYNYFSALGFSLSAICGMLGNIEHESWINPAMKQSTSSASGWGLIQWTPSTILRNWCTQYGYDWKDGTAQCLRIQAEGTGTMGAGGYWTPGSGYSYTWEQFSKLDDVTEATKAYLYQREKSGVLALQVRLEYAYKWYEYFSGVTPPIPPTPPTPTIRKKMPVYMMIRKRF